MRSPRAGCLLAALCAALVIGASGADAQTRGSLMGTIRDGAGAALPGVTLTLASPSLPGEPLVSETNARGRYRFPALPPGDYELTAGHAGLQTVRRTDLRIGVGTAVTVDLTLSVTGNGTVGGAGPMVDVTTPAFATKLSTEDLDNLPIADLRALLALVPGVTPRAAFGSAPDTSQFIVDGGPLNFTLRQGNAVAMMHPYWIKEVQMVGPGTNAGFGEASGVVANVALRSGSNRLSGLAEHRITRPGLVGDNTDRLPEMLRNQFRAQEVLSRWSSVAQLGGPINRDRLFFFSGFNYVRDEVLQAGTIGDAPLDYRAPGFLTTVQWAPRPDLRVDGHFEADRDRSKGSLARNALPETAGEATTSRRTWHGRATWTVNPNTLVDIQGGGVEFDSSNLPDARRSGPSPRFDRVSRIASGNAAAFGDSLGHRVVTNANLTRFVEGAGRSHELEFGVELERNTFRQVSGIPGGRSFQDAGGAPEFVTEWAGNTIEGSGIRMSMYLQDVWRAADRLSIHLGVRIGFNRGTVPDHGAVFSTNPVSPRIGMAWDVGADHRTVVRAAYGRIHEGLYPTLFDFMNTSNVTPTLTYFVLPNGTLELRQRSTPLNAAVDDNLAHAYVDQYVVGVERELVPDVSLMVQYLRRDFGDIWAFIDTGSQYAPVDRRDPGPDGLLGTPDDGRLLTVFNLLNPNQMFAVLTNPDGVTRRYDAVQAIAQKRFSHNWQLLAAYTWSKTRGIVNPSLGDNRASGGDSGRGGIFFNPNRRINADGRSSADLPHQLTAQGTWMLPFWGGLNLSGGYSYLSGAPWGRAAIITGLQVNQIVRVEPRGTRQTDDAYALDMRIEKTFRLRGSRTVGIYVDAFNLTNRGVPLAQSVVEVSGATFGEPATGQWATPRTIQLAGRIRF